MAQQTRDPSRFVRKLQHFTTLSAEEKLALQRFEVARNRIESQTDLIVQGDVHAYIYIFRDGWAIRSRTLPDGACQILDVVLPGDVVGLAAPLFTIADHTVTSVTSVIAATVTGDQLIELFRAHPRLGAALCWHQAQEEAVVSEHLVNLGRRDAYRRLGHLFLELFWRLDAVGLVCDNAYDCPLSQPLLADALGLTAVHINRTLQRLRRDRLLLHERPRVVIPDPIELAQAVGFDESYLHLSVMPLWLRRYLTRVETL